MIGAKAQAELAQGGAPVLVQRLHGVGDARALQHAQGLGNLKADAARYAFKPGMVFEFRDGSKQFGHMLGQP